MARDDGGPAFPSKGPTFGGLASNPLPGMLLRDYFAAQALVLASDPNNFPRDYAKNGLLTQQGIAQYCYAIADALLTEREK